MINLRFYQIKEILLQTSLFASKKTPKWWSYFTSLRTIPKRKSGCLQTTNLIAVRESGSFVRHI